MGKKIFLDVDIDGSRDAFKRATEFVATSSIKYGLSTDDVTKLGGRSLLLPPPPPPPPARPPARRPHVPPCSPPRICNRAGREIKELPELYAADYEWNSRGPCKAKPQSATRIIIEVAPLHAPAHLHAPAR